MKNPYIASSIANYFISNKNLDVDNLKLNKLVYISYGFALACFKEELELFKEPIQAWRLGPVIPSIYHEFKRYGYNSIKNLSYFYDPMQEKKIFFSIDEDDTKTKEVLEAVKNNYGNLKRIGIDRENEPNLHAWIGSLNNSNSSLKQARANP